MISTVTREGPSGLPHFPFAQLAVHQLLQLCSVPTTTISDSKQFFAASGSNYLPPVPSKQGHFVFLHCRDPGVGNINAGSADLELKPYVGSELKNGHRPTLLAPRSSR
jgi:hypothetical protein